VSAFLVCGLISIAVLLLLIILGMHIALALAISGFLGLLLITGLEPAIWKATTSIYHRIANYELITIPLFVMMGLLAAGGGISSDLYDAAQLWVGRIPGGLGIATVLGCTGFGTVCGSSLVTASVFAKVAAPHMRRHGYNKRLAYGICASAGMIGMLIPPSVLIVIYGFVSGESVGKLLIGGTCPGLLLMTLFVLGLLFMPKIKPDWVILNNENSSKLGTTYSQPWKAMASNFRDNHHFWWHVRWRIQCHGSKLGCRVCYDYRNLHYQASYGYQGNNLVT
jgi:C4-dicarboxylate transporter DctM subunit